MGRHGGGSRSGGRRRSSGGSSGTRSSSEPFKGCYNRSFYHKGKYYSYYTSDRGYGVSVFSRIRTTLLLVGIILYTALMLFAAKMIAANIFYVGEKINGNPDRILIQDTIDILTPEEERKALDLFNRVYSESGMPITLYTDDMQWQDNYESIEVYSEELYYAMGTEEDAMIILFTYDGTFEWVYDMYCGDDTIKCLSNRAFNKLLDNFQKGMAGQNLYDALEYSLNSIMDDFVESYIDSSAIVGIAILIVIYVIFFAIMYHFYSKERNAYKYFKENPDKVDNTPMLVKYVCPSCGAHNSNLLEVCEYCGTILKM